MKTPRFSELEGRSPGFFALMAVLIAIIGVGVISALTMHGEGHIITGMTNRIVWGTPHVFAVFLIVAASGALNVASISSVFGRTIYKPLSPLSMVMSVAILIGGLAVLILDLGRPEHLLDVPVLQFFYNSMPARWSHSVFGWNMILYTGFIGIVMVYLWFTLAKQYNKYAKAAAVFAFVWRLALTTGTGLIFGFLVAREAYDAAILAPMFVVLSFVYGLALFCLVLIPAYTWTGRELGDVIVERLRKLLGIFIAAALYFVIVLNLTNFYSAAKADGIQNFLLFGGNSYSQTFWFGQILIGSLIPLALTLLPNFKSRGALIIASLLVVIGGLSQMYVTIIGGQAYPMDMFPGKEVSSIIGDGAIVEYSASIYEVLLGLGGIAITLFIAVFAMNVLKILPESLADKDIDPHHSA
jgi:Ni/Fe-hydrogenase subunit HybB-like protein